MMTKHSTAQTKFYDSDNREIKTEEISRIIKDLFIMGGSITPRKGLPMVFKYPLRWNHG